MRVTALTTRRLVAVAALVAAAAAGAPASSARGGADPGVRARLAEALRVAHVDPTRSAALVVDLASGEVVFSHNQRLPLVPASTEKLAVAYGVLARLGPAYRIRTRVIGDGGLGGATWHGDLVLKGYGDPTLATPSLRRLARQIRGRGIRRVTGAVVGDESFFDAQRMGPGWRASFYIRESAPLSALVVDGAVYRGAVSRNPALAAASLLRAELRGAGVTVAQRSRVGIAPPDEVELAAVASPPLLAILRRVNRESDNFTAEMLLKHLGAVALGRGTSAAGATVVTRALAEAEVPLSGVRVVDGSGLSPLDRLTADSLVGILAAAWQDPLLRRAFLDSLAVAGRSGTLRHRLRTAPVAGRVVAKTGTTSLSSALAGYVNGRYAFALVSNGAPVWSWWCRRAQDRFVTVLARQ